MVKRAMYFYDKKQANLIMKVNDRLHLLRAAATTAMDNDKSDAEVITNILYKAAQKAAQQYYNNKGLSSAIIYKMLSNKLIEFKNIIEKMGAQYLKVEQLISAISSIKDPSAPKEFNMLKRDTISQLKNALK